MIIRQAVLSDVPDITTLIHTYAHKGQILPRSSEAIQDNIDTWIVADHDQIILACGSLLSYSPKLAEVRSLVVVDQFRRRGLGTAVVQALIVKAQHQHVRTLFALTRVVPFFEYVGFTLTDKNGFPEKVWRDCAFCSLQDKCDENAVVLHLDGVTPSLRSFTWNIKGEQYDSIKRS